MLSPGKLHDLFYIEQIYSDQISMAYVIILTIGLSMVNTAWSKKSARSALLCPPGKGEDKATAWIYTV